MAILSVQTIDEDGQQLATVAAAGGGDSFDNPSDQSTFLYVNNAGGSSITVTITAQATSRDVPGLGPMTKPNAGGAVTNGTIKLFGPFPAEAFNNASGQVAVSYSGVTSVTVAVLRLQRRAS